MGRNLKRHLQIARPGATATPLVKQQTRPYCVHTPTTGQASMSLVLKIRVFVLRLAAREMCQCCDRRIHSAQTFVLFTDSMMGMNGHSLKCTGVGCQVSSPKLSDIQQRTLAAARRGMIHQEHKRGRSWQETQKRASCCTGYKLFISERWNGSFVLWILICVKNLSFCMGVKPDRSHRGKSVG